MARIPYADERREDIQPLVERIVAQRGSLLHLYRMLLHSPPVAEGWLAYTTAIRQRCELPGALRELAIMRVAMLTGASYEAAQHAPFALREGVTQAQLDALPGWEASDAYDACQRAVLAYADAMTLAVHVPRPVFDAVKAHLDHRQLVECTATIATYNMVSRFLEALGIHADEADG